MQKMKERIDNRYVLDVNRSSPGRGKDIKYKFGTHFCASLLLIEE